MRTVATLLLAIATLASPVRLEAATGPSAGGVEHIKARYGRHPGFQRLVFEWRGPIEYRLNMGQRTATVMVNRPGHVDLPRLRARIKYSGIAVETLSAGGRLKIKLRLPPGRRLRHYREGGKVVLDILDQEPPGRVESPARVTLKVNAASGRGSPRSQRSAPSPGVAPVAGKIARPKKPPMQSTARDDNAPTQLLAKISDPLPGPRLVKKNKTPGASAGIASRGERKDEIVEGVSLVRRGGSVALRFVWPRRVAAAAFRRGRHIWLAFSESAQFNLGPVRAGLTPSVFAIDQIPHETGAILRIATAPGINPVVRNEGRTWLVDFRQVSARPKSAVRVKPEPNAAKGARVVIGASATGPVLRVSDPDSGDGLIVVPLAESGHGIERDQVYPEFRSLRTTQGIAIEPFTDQITVTSGSDGVEVTTPKGLRLSPGLGISSVSGMPVSGRLFQFARWAGGAKRLTKSFTRRKHELQAAVASASNAERNSRRLALARFFFAHGFSADALGALKLVAEEDSDLIHEPAVLAMRGAARFLIGNFEAAAADFYQPALDLQPEVALWRGALAAANEDWYAAASNFARAEGLLRYYPMPLKMRFGLMAAEAEIVIGNADRARRYVIMLSDDTPPASVRDELDYLRGRILRLIGEPEAAVSQWVTVAARAVGASRVKATVARMDADLARGKLDTDSAIPELDRLRFAWRGDNVEFSVLHLLGRLYLMKGDYHKGFKTLTRATELFPKPARTRQMAKEMRRAFADAFLSDGTDRMSPLKALALYEEFKALTPSDRRGDRMIEKLADRMVAVDLLDRAADLLSEQMQRRLSGDVRARVAARLALVHLLRGMPKQALAVLASSRIDKVPAELALQRRGLEARAYAALDRSADALRVIVNDNGPDAEALRADIHWQAQNWSAAAGAFAKVAIRIGPPRPGKALGEADSRIVLQWVIALVLAGDKTGLAQARKRFDTVMAKGPHADAYRVVAGDLRRGPVDISAIVEMVAEADRFQSFMANYRTRLQSGGLSAIN